MSRASPSCSLPLGGLRGSNLLQPVILRTAVGALSGPSRVGGEMDCHSSYFSSPSPRSTCTASFSIRIFSSVLSKSLINVPSRW